MDYSADDYAGNSLRLKKEERRRKDRAMEFCNGMISGAVSQLYKAQKKNSGKLPHCFLIMSEVPQGLLDKGTKAMRDSLNNHLNKYVKPAGMSVEAPTRAPLSVNDVNRLKHQSNISSLHGVEGVKNGVTTITNKAGRPNGSTKYQRQCQQGEC
jgi:hypothetical protein